LGGVSKRNLSLILGKIINSVQAKALGENCGGGNRRGGASRLQNIEARWELSEKTFRWESSSCAKTSIGGGVGLEKRRKERGNAQGGGDGNGGKSGQIEEKASLEKCLNLLVRRTITPPRQTWEGKKDRLKGQK